MQKKGLTKNSVMNKIISRRYFMDFSTKREQMNCWEDNSGLNVVLEQVVRRIKDKDGRKKENKTKMHSHKIND